jgi:hypothetical protein
MSENEGSIELPAPTGCVLWNDPAAARKRFAEMFEALETYDDDGHLTRTLYRCRECGQLYFHEWYEWIDWDHGNDKQYSTMLPVQTAEQIAALKATNIFELLRYVPRLQWDRGIPEWVGRD